VGHPSLKFNAHFEGHEEVRCHIGRDRPGEAGKFCGTRSMGDRTVRQKRNQANAMKKRREDLPPDKSLVCTNVHLSNTKKNGEEDDAGVREDRRRQRGKEGDEFPELSLN